MSEQWFYRMFGEQFGPMPFEKLKELADDGTIQALDQVRSESSGSWVNAATIDGLELSASFRGDISNVTTATSISDFEISTTPTSTDEWYCSLGDHELGPISFEELLKFAENEKLSRDDQVKLGANGKWRRAGSIGRLVAVMPYQAVEKKIIRKANSLPKQSEAPTDEFTVTTTIKTVDVASAVAKPVASVPDPEATYRVAYEQAKARLMETMLAQADSVYKTAEDQAHSQVAWANGPSVDKYWWGWAGGVEFGPVEFTQVFGLAKSGQLKPSDFVKNGQHGQFVPSSGVPGLFKAIEILAKATETRNLARTQAQAAASLAAPPPTVPTELLKAAEKAIAVEQAAAANQIARVNPATPSTPTPKSNPLLETVKQQPRPASDPQIAIRASAPIAPERVPDPEPVVEAPRPSYPASSMGGNYSSSMNGAYSTSSSTMSTYGMNSGMGGFGGSRPTPVPLKPQPRKKVASDSRWLSDMTDNLKDPKAIGAFATIALVLLIVGWGYLPKSRSADIRNYNTLKQMLADIKAKRSNSPGELGAIEIKLTKLAKEIAADLKTKANPHEPAKQCLLWATRDEVPRMVQAGLATESAAEKNFAMKLNEAAIELGLEKRPPVDLAQLQARANDD